MVRHPLGHAERRPLPRYPLFGVRDDGVGSDHGVASAWPAPGKTRSGGSGLRRGFERERLLGGNWKIRPAAGLYFKREWCAVADAAPAELDVVRYWDLAATEKTELNDPDWTVGIKLGDRSDGYWLLDMVRARANPGDVERLMLNTAAQDGKQVKIGFGLTAVVARARQ
jgi:hypothetical protein